MQPLSVPGYGAGRPVPHGALPLRELLVSAGAPTAATPSIKRDMWTEQQTLDRRPLFPQVEGKYCIVGEDRALNFLTEQLQCLYRLGEVYISERLRGKRIRDSRAAIGVSLSDGMLELKLDTGNSLLKS